MVENTDYKELGVEYDVDFAEEDPIGLSEKDPAKGKVVHPYPITSDIDTLEIKEPAPAPILLSEEQTAAADTAAKWWKSTAGRNWLVLGGIAGSGKTFMLPGLIQRLGVSAYAVRYVAFTGKAAHVMASRGMRDATTIHRLIYNVIKTLDKGVTKITFEKKPDSELEGISLIVVDEASMVSEEIFNDLSYYGIPLVFAGDHCQLPPVKGTFNLMDEDNLDVRLDEIHRQAAGNPILVLSSDVRHGRPVKKHFGEVTSKIGVEDMSDDMLMQADQVITGKNDTRHWLNAQVRRLKGFVGEYPRAGEKLIFLKNNYRLNIRNGQQVEVLENCRRLNDNDKTVLVLNYVDGDGNKNEINLSTAAFDNKGWKQGQDDGIVAPDSAVAGYGYAITCHKSQGSEWDSVLLYDDGFASWDEELRRKFLYTAVTRAKKKIIIVCK